MKLAQRVAAVKSSLTLALNAKAKALQAAGKDVVSLTAGELDFPPPDVVAGAVAASLARGEHRYTPVAGTASLREAIADAIAVDLGERRYEPSAVLVSCGAKHSLYNLIQVLCDPGDEVLIPTPYWLSYPAMALLAQAVPVFVSCGPDFKLAPEALEQAITARTRVVLLNSPGNPTGAVYSAEELEALAAVMRRHPDVVIISDEIYDRLVYGPLHGKRAPSIVALAPDLAERTVLVNGVSKTYAMTGLRIGWAAGPAAVIGAATRLQSHSTSNPASIAQAAAEAALRAGLASLGPVLDALEARRQIVIDALAAMPGVKLSAPAGAFYAFPDCSGLLGREAFGRPLTTALDLAEVLLERAEVAVVPGDPFGAPTCLRLSFATSTGELERALARMGTLFAEIAGAR